MNAMGYIKSLTILFLSGVLMLGFNNCSEVAFQEATGGTVSKISDDNVVDTNEIDGIEITDENVEEYEEVVRDLAEEQSESDGGSSEENSEDDEDVASNDENRDPDGDVAEPDSSGDSSDQEDSSEETDGSEEVSHNDEGSDTEEKKRSCGDKKKEHFTDNAEGGDDQSETDYSRYECKNSLSAHSKGQAKSVICHITPSGVKLEKCLPLVAIRAQLQIPLRNAGHTVYSGPCLEE